MKKIKNVFLFNIISALQRAFVVVVLLRHPSFVDFGCLWHTIAVESYDIVAHSWDLQYLDLCNDHLVVAVAAAVVVVVAAVVVVA